MSGGWRSRLILEERELRTRYQDLKSFTEKEDFHYLDPKDKHFLLLQGHYMQGYLEVLRERLKSAYPSRGLPLDKAEAKIRKTISSGDESNNHPPAPPTPPVSSEGRA